MFVEGQDDERFFDAVYGNCFQKAFGCYQIVTYRQKKEPEFVKDYLRSIQRMKGTTYLFFHDADGKPIEREKKELIEKYRPYLSDDKVFVVQLEIESWYYAGLDETSCKEIGLKRYEYRTDALTKEELYAKFPPRAKRVAIMNAILNHYSIQAALNRNHSFSLFHHSLQAAETS